MDLDPIRACGRELCEALVLCLFSVQEIERDSAPAAAEAESLLVFREEL